MEERRRRLYRRYPFLLSIAMAIGFSSRKFHQALWWPVRPLAVRQYLRSHEVRKLHIGAGSRRLPGWLNTDRSSSFPRLVFLDAAARYPFRDATIDYIYSHHVIEHLTYEQGQLMLRECFRVLKPGGRIRTATPDLETLAGLCTPQKTDLQQRYIHWAVDKWSPEMGIYHEGVVLNNAFKYPHQFLYDYAMLKMALEKVGFAAVTRYNLRESDDEAFRGIETRAPGHDELDEEMIAFETLVVEARRPL